MKLARKLRHIIDSKIAGYIFKRYPYLVEFIRGFAEFLDQESTQDALNLTDNLDPSKMFVKYLTLYFDQFCKNMIDPNEYQLSNDNKRLFISIIKFLNDNKGKRFSFDIALRYMKNFFSSTRNNFVSSIDYEIEEIEANWKSIQLASPYPVVWQAHEKPYTYLITGDFVRSLVYSLIVKLNPVGFWPEFKIEYPETEENYSVADNATEDYEIIAVPSAPIIFDDSELQDGTDVDTMWESSTMDKLPGSADDSFWADITWDDFSPNWLRLTVSSLSGTYTTPSRDLGQYFSIRLVPDVKKLLPTGTSATISFRYSEDEVTWSTWEVVSTADIVAEARYVQWKVELASADPTLTPFVIRMKWTIQAELFS